jgi:hypothetical protein
LVEIPLAHHCPSGGGKLYPEALPFRQELTGSGPWFASLGNRNQSTLGTATRAGDRGFVVRTYAARVNGVSSSRPSLSVFCDRVEVSPPSSAGSTLQEGDFVEFRLESLIPPRLGADLDLALASTSSNTLAAFKADVDGVFAFPSDVVAAQARGQLHAVAFVGQVESHYPVSEGVATASKRLLPRRQKRRRRHS